MYVMEEMPRRVSARLYKFGDRVPGHRWAATALMRWEILGDLQGQSKAVARLVHGGPRLLLGHVDLGTSNSEHFNVSFSRSEQNPIRPEATFGGYRASV
jgi:hypothetical protein